MFTSIILAGSLPLVAINSDDNRLLEKDTFVSGKAVEVLAGERQGDILCLDRTEDGSICLTRKEWNKAVTMANAQPRLRNLHRVVNRQNTFANNVSAIGTR